MNPTNYPYRLCQALLIAIAITHFAVIRSVDAATVTQDKVKSLPGTLTGNATYTPTGGGHSGQTGDYGIDLTRAGGYVAVPDASFLNAATVNDELTVAMWIKKYDIANSSAFWVDSPSNGRVFQAHTPWSDNVIYFDTMGAAAGVSRINANIDTFPDFTGDLTDISWWTNSWHLFVFSKKGETKQIWIDGKLFLEDINTAVLASDIGNLNIGAQSGGGGQMHGLIDDFTAWSTALTEAQVMSLFNGTLPTALPASAGLLAWWDFNDFPPEGVFSTMLPAPGTTTADPNLIQIVHADGAVPWTANNVSLKIDNVAVAATFTKVASVATLRFVPSPFLPAQSTHTASLTYPDATGAPKTLEWSFTVGIYTTDKVQSYLGVLRSNAGFTGNVGGHTGQAGDFGIDLSRLGGYVAVADASFLNAGTVNDELSVAMWIKRYDIANSSVFWVDSPSNGRVFQAHAPWSDNVIYFDTMGAAGGVSRISANIDTFPDFTGDTTDLTWWTDKWHLLVFSKKGETKEIWIDGKLFLSDVNTAVLATNIGRLNIGADTSAGNQMHGIIDDFSAYSKALTEAQVMSLFNGTLPTALGATAGLLAYWDFNDIPAQGIFSGVSPTPNTTNAAPSLITITHQDGTTQWDTNKVTLRVNNNPVTATVTKAGSLVTVRHVPGSPFAIGSTQTAALLYDGAVVYQWSFTVGLYTKDVVRNNIGVLTGAAKFTPAGGGKSGAAADFGMDFGQANAGQSVQIIDASFLNEAAVNDEMAIASWQKLYQIADSALFWGISPSTGQGNRGFSAHTPWSNNTIYFDTAGCCDGATQRINAGIDTFDDYNATGNTGWWTNWHHFVFQKKLSTKEIWIDGKLFLTGDNTNPLPTDFTIAWLGNDPPDNARLRGIIDDFAVFGTALTEANVNSLVTGTAPTGLPASTKLLAYWNFNDPPTTGGPRPTVAIVTEGSNVKLTYTGILQSTDRIDGTWTDVQGATNPYTTAPVGTRFYRTRNP